MAVVSDVEFHRLALVLQRSRLVRCLDDAYDLLQDASLKLLQNFAGAFESISGALFWTTLRNLALDAFRSREKHLERPLDPETESLAHPLADGEFILMLSEFLAFLRLKIAELPREQREVLAGLVLEGRSIEEIVRRTGKEPSTVYGLLENGGRTLRDAMRGHEDWKAFAVAFDDGWLSKTARRPKPGAGKKNQEPNNG